MIEQAEKALEGKNIASTNYLHIKLGITKNMAARLYKKLGWTKYGSSSNNTTFKRKGVDL